MYQNDTKSKNASFFQCEKTKRQKNKNFLRCLCKPKHKNRKINLNKLLNTFLDWLLNKKPQNMVIYCLQNRFIAIYKEFIFGLLKINLNNRWNKIFGWIFNKKDVIIFWSILHTERIHPNNLQEFFSNYRKNLNMLWSFFLWICVEKPTIQKNITYTFFSSFFRKGALKY